MPIIRTLFHIEKHDQFQHPFKRDKDDSLIQDIYDSKSFTDLMST